MDLEAKFKAVVTDLEAVYRRIEVVISAHTAGELTPQHLEDARDSCDAAIQNAKSGLGPAAGTRVADTGAKSDDDKPARGKKG